MNPDKPSRDEIEVKLTALLLGELPADEAKLLRYTIAQDANLQKLHDELAATVVLVREVAKNPAEASGEKNVPLKLSDARREKLLAHFKTPRKPGPLFWLKRIDVPKLVTVFGCVALVALIATMFLPALASSKKKAQKIYAANAAKQRALEVEMATPAQSMSLDKSDTALAASTPPPSVQIVLPPTESSQPVDPATGLPSDDRKPGAISQSIVGYTAINSLPAGTPLAVAALTPAHKLVFDSDFSDGRKKSEVAKATTDVELALSGRSQIAGVNNAAPLPGGARFGGAGGGGAGETPTSGGSNLAWFDSAANRSTAESLPQEKLPALAVNGLTDQDLKSKNSPTKNSNTLLTAGLRQGQTRAPQAGEAITDFGLQTSTVAASNGDSLAVARGFYRQPARDRLDSNGSIAPATPPSAKPVSNAGIFLFASADIARRAEEPKLMDKSGSGTPALGDVPKDSFKTGLAKEDAGGLRYLIATNAIVAGKIEAAAEVDKPLPQAKLPAPIPQPEILTRENNFSTFSLNVSDVSFKLAAASLENGKLPDANSIRSEEFINAFDYRDAEAAAGQPLAFAAERARYPFAHNRDLLRFSVKTAAAGRPAGRALNLVLLLDNSGSMERADRVAIIREALRVLASQLQPQDTVSVVTFARTARLWADGVSGDTAGAIFDRVGGITPEGGTNLEEAMRLAYETARKHYQANGLNRVVLLTDGAANLGNVSTDALKEKVEAQRKQGIALDCFGIGFEDYNDDLLEQLSSHGDGRYAFLNSPEDAQKDFAAKLAGALQIAAQDVKVQVEFNSQRVISWRQIGYAKHQLTKEQFRDNTVDAAEIAAQEAGNALYAVETKADGVGPVATVRVRYRVPGTTEYRERSWNVEYAGVAPALEKSSPAMRLAATASAFSEWLAGNPFAQEVTLDELQKILTGVPQIYGADERPKKLEAMLREARSVAGK